MRINYIFSLNSSFYIDFAFFFLLSQKKEEETRECFAFCKKKKERPWAGERLQANMGIFRLFPAGKVSTSSKRDIRCDTHLCSHKRDSVTKIPRVTHSVRSGFGNNSFRKGWSKISVFSQEKFRHCRKESFEENAESNGAFAKKL